jgi:hypothetical protein
VEYSSPTISKARLLWQICGVINECAGQFRMPGNNPFKRSALFPFAEQLQKTADLSRTAGDYPPCEQHHKSLLIRVVHKLRKF